MHNTFTEEKIREHLGRILRTRPFTDSMVLTRFLTFIVNEALAGRSHELKEYTIGTNALNRDTDFNPQIDSIVRIHAGRLRRALKEYYYERGKHDELEILVPKGSYVPQFIGVSAYPSTDEPGEKANNHLLLSRNISFKHKTSLAIFPFDDISESETHGCFVKGLGVYLSARLTNDPSLALVSYYFSNHLPDKIRDMKEAGDILKAAFILTGCVQADKHLRVHILLNACETGEQLWGMTFERKDLEKLDLFLLQEEIVNNVTTVIGGPGGLISTYNPAKPHLQDQPNISYIQESNIPRNITAAH